tara:strand:+ start:3597 stop:4448 length:852 start_codon:yes stop_codon:yes gene_type:complete
MWRKLLNINKSKDPKNDTEIIDVLDQLKTELTNDNLHIKKELHQLTKYFNKIPISYAIIGYDGSLVRVNKSLSRLLSCRNTDCIGTNVLDYIHPDDDKMFKNFIKNLRKGKEEDDNDSGEIIIRLLPKTGNSFYIKWGAVHLENEQMVMLFGQDITHEMELSDRLSDFITYKNTIIDNYPGSILSVNLKGTIKEFNKSAEIRTGYKREELVNKKHIFDIFPNKNLLIEDNLNTIQKTFFKKKDGALEETHVFLLPLLNEHKNKIGYLGVCHSDDYLKYIKLNS